jgi:hypothetical protein
VPRGLARDRDADDPSTFDSDTQLADRFEERRAHLRPATTQNMADG